MKKNLHILLLISFVLALLVPVTGIHIHKLASLFFLLLCLVHTGLHWKGMNLRRDVVLGLVSASFLTGLLGMIFEEIPMILGIHKVFSLVVVFFLAIHIFVFSNKIFSHKGMSPRLIGSSGETQN